MYYSPRRLEPVKTLEEALSAASRSNFTASGRPAFVSKHVDEYTWDNVQRRRKEEDPLMEGGMASGATIVVPANPQGKGVVKRWRRRKAAEPTNEN